MTDSPVQKIKKSIEAEKPVVAILCEDPLRRERATTLFLDEIKTKNPRIEISHHSLQNPSKLALQAIIESTHSLSLFAKEKFFFISHVETLNAELQKILLEVISQASPLQRFLIVGEKILSTTLLYKTLSKHQLIELKPLKGAELFQWTKKEIESVGLSANTHTIELLISASSEAPWLIGQRILLLNLYFDSNGVVTSDILKKMFSLESHHEDFALLNKVISDSQLPILEKHLYSDPPNPFGFLTLMVRNTATLSALSSAPQRKAALPGNPWMINKLLDPAKKFKNGLLARKLTAILRAESRLKHHSLEASRTLGTLIREWR